MPSEFFPARVDPQAQAVLDQIAAAAAAAPPSDHAPSEAERVAATRRGYAGTAFLGGEPEPVARVEDREVTAARPAAVDDPRGTARVPVRIYDPGPSPRPRPETARPALLWLHGGSFVAGDFVTHDRPLRALANRLGFPVAAVAWRLAPEHPYPAGLDDAAAVLWWLATGAGDLAVDPARLAVGGDSAGGALAAVLARRARDAGLALAYQVLVYPNTDLAGDGTAYPSWEESDGRVLTRSDMERNFALYAGGADRANPELSPVRAPDLGGLAPAYVVTAEADPQRDEGEAYAARLQTAGVAVAHTRYPGMIHGFFQMAGVVDAGRRLIDDVAARVRARLTSRSAAP